jgi:hypothetical protein
MEVAQQRVMQQYGSTALHSRMFKNEDASARYQRIAKEIQCEDGCSLEEPTRKARIPNPFLYKWL